MDQEEISNKIRKAIKAKLTELGSYIDDELPDYIMVMIANKKDMSQMANDLELFLSENAEPFTTWLENLLDRLQSVSQAVLKPESPEVTASRSQSKSELQNISSKSNPDVDDALTIHPPDEDDDEFRDEADDELVEAPVKEVPDVKSLISKRETKPAVKTEKSVVRSQHANQSQVVTTQKKKMISTRGDSDSLLPKAAVAPSRRPVAAPPSSASTHVSQAEHSASRSSAERQTRQISPTRTIERRRAPASSRLGVADHVVDGGRDRRFDSDKARITSVREGQSSRGGGYSSRDRDRYRDRSRNRSRSADRSRDRDRSADRSADRPRERELDRFRTRSRHNEMRDRDRSPARRAPLRMSSRIASVRTRTEPDFSESDDDEDTIATRPQLSSVASVVKITERKSSVPESLQANKKLLLKAMADVTKSLAPPPIEVVPEKPKAPERRSAKQRIGRASASQPTISDRQRARLGRYLSHSRPRSRSSSRSRSRTPINDEELLEALDLLRARKRRRQSARDRSRSGDQNGSSGRRGGSGIRKSGDNAREHLSRPDDELPLSDEDFVREEDVQVVESKPVKQRLGIRPESPKFVVTLDAVSDMNKLLPNYQNLVEAEVDEIDLIDRQNDLPSEASFHLNAVSSRQSVSDKSSIPCRYLPNCTAGSACPYLHPMCTKYPNCQFGAYCKYKHPTPSALSSGTIAGNTGPTAAVQTKRPTPTPPLCKFDVACTRPNCLFTHTLKGAALSISKPASQTVCKFFPKCTNMACPYVHPKPCKFGISCLKRTTGCQFTHPSLPTQPQLKWSRATATN